MRFKREYRGHDMKAGVSGGRRKPRREEEGVWSAGGGWRNSSDTRDGCFEIHFALILLRSV